MVAGIGVGITVGPPRYGRMFPVAIPSMHPPARSSLHCREAYGMERWLVGPERGVRALVAMCLQLYR